MIDPKLKSRFRSKIDDSGDCWIWTAGKTSDGYPKFKVSMVWNSGHRVSWQIYRGPIPPTHVVCACKDSRLCVNPSHLELRPRAKRELIVHEIFPVQETDTGT